jgi:FkbM family methyltransferase
MNLGKRVTHRLWRVVRLPAYRILARSRTVARVALHVRRAATIQVRHRLVESMEAEGNGELWLISTLGSRVEIAFDVGANIGLWSSAALRDWPNLAHLSCFEPSDAAVDMIKARLGDDPRVHIVRAAVSDEEGRVSFFEEPGASQTSSLVSGLSNEAELNTIDVPVVTVDGEMHRQSLDQLDVLKIDVEGYDLHVLRGAHGALRRQAIELVQFEYNRPWMYAGSTLQGAATLLAECDYELFLLNKTGLCRCDVSRLGELFEYLNFVAIPKARLDRLPMTINPDPLWG